MKATRCPFCNSNSRLVMECNQSVFWVHCLECGADGPHSTNALRAIQFWDGDHKHQNPSALVGMRNENQKMTGEVLG